MSSATAPAAGWFTDPNDTASLRWWDGSAWTEHVHPAVVASNQRDTAAQPQRAHDQDWTRWPARAASSDRPGKPSLDGWFEERGFQRIVIAPTAIEPIVAPLRAAGMHRRFRHPIAGHGPAWAAAPDSTIVECSYEQGEARRSVTLVSVPLDQSVGSLVSGIALDAGSEVGCLLGSALFERRQWFAVELAPDLQSPSLQVRAAPEQDRAIVDAVADAATMGALAVLSQRSTSESIGVAIGSGRLVGWCLGTCLHDAVAGNGGDLDVLVELTALAHRRAVELRG